MGLDVGTGGGRCLLVNTETGGTVNAHRAWVHLSTPEARGLAFDLDTAHIWRLLGEMAQEALRKAGCAPREVAGVAATSFRQATVAIDKHGHVLLATPNKDARAVDQGMRLAMERGEELYRVTGHTPSPATMAARLLWLKEKRPELLKSVSAVLAISDWIGYRLSGAVAANPAQAAESLRFDLQERRWASEVIQSLGLPERVLPHLKNAGTRLGKLTQEAAANLGLVPGVPVAVGGPDSQCGLLGAGVVSLGQIGVIAGTNTPIQMAVDKPIIDGEMRLWAGLHILPDMYVLESNAGLMGSPLEWIARLIHADAPNPVAVLAAEAENSVPGAHGTVSTFGAAVFNASALEPPVDSLTFSSLLVRGGSEGRADLARAILEGMAYAVRANIEQIQQVSGRSASELYLAGGLTRSATWTQMISDVMGCKVRVPATIEASALGAAICAGVGAGLYPDLQSGVVALTHYSREHMPHDPDSQAYQAYYADWQSLRAERRPADMVAASQITSALLSSASLAESRAGAVPFRPKVYVSAEVDEAALRRLRELGEVTYAPYRKDGILLTGDDLVQTLKGYQVFVTEVDIVDAESLLQLPDLRMIAVCRGNPVNIDIQACTLASVPVVNTPARNADAVADLAVGFVLMLARRLQSATAFLHEPGSEAGDLGRMGRSHEEFLGIELWHKTIGVVGGGAIGHKVIQRLLPFGSRILLCDPNLTSGQAAILGAEKVSLESLLEASDFITLHAPVIEATRNMFDAKAFERMKPGAFLINTARAALIDPEALLAALRSGRLGGAAFDVFPVEPPASDDPLLAFPNVITTPHVGGNTREVAAHQGEIVAESLEAVLEGKQPMNLLNPAAFESFFWSGARKTDRQALRARASAPGPGATDLDVAAQKKPARPAERNEPKGSPAAAILQPASLIGKDDSMVNTRPTCEKMIQILKEFTLRIAADPDLARFAKGKNVIFSFTVKDIDQAFYMSFLDGNVRTGLDSPAHEPEVKLKMSADTLDGMFTGRINATKAATSGKLSFSGDTGKAMAFIRIQNNLSRLYSEARQKIGDPGDLTKIDEGAPLPASVPPPASAVPVPTAPAIAKTGDVRDQILVVTNELYAKGLITPTGGNVSARCDDNPNEVWITPSAIFKGDLHPEMMVRINLEGKVLNDTEYPASSERRVHCAIYQNQPDTTAVIHSHAPQATLMALTGTRFRPISADAAFFGDIPVVPFILPGTEELAVQVAKAMLSNGIPVLMQNHGLVVAGSSLRRAADMTNMIEETAQKILTCKALGIEPVQLPEEIVKQLKEIGSAIG